MPNLGDDAIIEKSKAKTGEKIREKVAIMRAKGVPIEQIAEDEEIKSILEQHNSLVKQISDKRWKLYIEEHNNWKKIHNLISVAIQIRGMVTGERIYAWLQHNQSREQVSEAIENLQIGIDELSLLKDKLQESFVIRRVK